MSNMLGNVFFNEDMKLDLEEGNPPSKRGRSKKRIIHPPGPIGPLFIGRRTRGRALISWMKSKHKKLQ